MKPKIDLLASLNPAQRKAVIHEDGPLLIVAGAGTGKTTVLINRLAYLITEKNYEPDSILLATFTDKGAGELEERADKLLPYGYVNLWIHTFHGLSERLLRDHALDIGLSPNFKVLTQTEQWIMIKRHLDDFNLDYYRPLGDPTKFIHELISHFSRLKDEAVSPRQYLEYAEGLEADGDKKLSADDTPHALDLARLKELSDAYHVYNKLLLDNGKFDFGDLIVYTLKLLRERPNILKRYQAQFRSIMVDEFQDTNTAQYELVKLLAGDDQNLVAVGDDDQSIYKFRGASLSNIMQFKDDYPKAKEIVLTQNYRSGQTILDRAHEFITHNDPNRLETKLGLDKRLVSNDTQPGEARYLEFPTDIAETRGVVDKLAELHRSGQANNWADIAVLVRANSSADPFIKELARRNIPHQFVSLKGLYYKPIIMDLIAYLKLLDNYHEPAALYRVLNLAPFKISHRDLLALTKHARKRLWSLFETMEKIHAVTDITPEAAAAINRLLGLIRAHADLAKKQSAAKVFLTVVSDCFLPSLDQDHDQPAFNYLNQLYSKLKKCEIDGVAATLKDFIDIINLEMEAGETGAVRLSFEDADTVKIMTIHAAKGLEFGHVFIVNAVDKKFPTIHRGEKIPVPAPLAGGAPPDKETHLEEERRLFYVAMTRAKRGLWITGAKDYGGATAKKPSRFIDEAALSVKGGNATDSSTELERDIRALADPAPAVAYSLPETFSFSQLTAFERCPWQYKFMYILKMPIEDSAQLVFGRVIHSCLRQFLLPLLDGGTQGNLFGETTPPAEALTSARLLDYYGQYWQDAGYPNRKNADAYKKLGREMLTAFQSSLGPDYPRIMMLEKKFKLPLGRYTLTGTIDRVDRLPDGGVEIIDYKTGQPKEKLEYKDKRQLLLYQAALETVFGEKVSRLTFHYLKNNQSVSFAAKPGELEKVTGEMLDLINQIQAFDFTPRPGAACQNCAYHQLCEFTQI